MGFFSFIKSKITGVAAQGSAFVKIAEADVKELEVKGRIIAIEAANKVKNDAISFYEKEVARVHADVDKIKSDFDALLSKL